MKKILTLILSLVLIAAFMPAAALPVFAEGNVITEVTFNVKIPPCHYYVSGLDDAGSPDSPNLQKPQAEVTIADGQHFHLNGSETTDRIVNYATWYYLSDGGSAQRLGGRTKYMTGDGTYYARISFKADEGYQFADFDQITFNINNGALSDLPQIGFDENMNQSNLFTDGSSYLYVLVSIPVVHVSDNNWVADPDSYTEADYENPATHVENTHCTLCGGVVDTRTVIDGDPLPQPEPEPEPEPEPAPPTGDQMRTWLIILAVSAACLVLALTLGRKRTNTSIKM